MVVDTAPALLEPDCSVVPQRILEPLARLELASSFTAIGLEVPRGYRGEVVRPPPHRLQPAARDPSGPQGLDAP